MENSLNLLEASRLYLPCRNKTGIDVGDIMRLNSEKNNVKTVETMFETGTGLAGASSAYDMPRQTHARHSRRHNKMNYEYTDSPYPYDYGWDNADAQAIMYNRYLAIHRASVVIRLLLFVVLVLLIVKIVKK
jgi:hypothetical protein